MKAKKWMITLCACSLTTALLAGCGNNAESTNGNVQIDNVQVDETKEAEAETQEGDTQAQDTGNQSTQAESADQPTIMKVTAIDGNQVTAVVMRRNPGQRGDGDAPEEKDGERPEKPQGEAPTGENGEMPEKPQGKLPEGQGGKRQTITFTITEETQISQASESGNTEATLDQITTDSMIQVELNENNEAISIVIQAMENGK